jgi:segregation and condensation protein A
LEKVWHHEAIHSLRGRGEEARWQRASREFTAGASGSTLLYTRPPQPAVDDNYKVKLDIFEGPLDLLLYLIKKDEVDILDVNIERITRQYIVYLDTFKMLNIDLAGEFIVMAANLMYLKSRMLIPKQVQPPEEEGDEEDPRWELIRQLIEYKKFKDAAGFLSRRQVQMENVYPASPEVPDLKKEDVSGFPELGIFDLIRAFQKVLNRFQKEDLKEIVDDRFTVADKIEHLLVRVLPGERISFLHLFAEATTRDEVIVTFVAMLELIKLRQFRVTQDHLLGEITLFRNENT